jgi:hypothetical protein
MTIVQKVDPDRDPLQTHKTRLPTWLYPLSFCPPVPSPWRHPVLFMKHPLPLYALGIVSALVAGACLPASGIVYGWWTNGVTATNGSSESKLERSREAGWIMTVIGIAAFLFSWLFLFCCECQAVTRKQIPTRLITPLCSVSVVATASDIITLHLRRVYVSSVVSSSGARMSIQIPRLSSITIF